MKKVFCGFLCLLLCIISFGCNNISYWHKQTNVFSNIINFEIDMIGEKKERAYNEMLEMLDELNRQINVNVADVDILTSGDNPSDILRLNLANANQTVKIGYHAYYLLEVSKEMYELTDTAFNVASYPLAYLWGVDAISCKYYNINIFAEEESPVPPSFVNSSIRSRCKPSEEQIQEAMNYCDLNGLEIWEENGEYYAKKNIKELMVDLGGIAKGYAADLCAEICEKYQIESALINISGNIYMFGKMYERKWLEEWEMSLREPKAYSSNILCKFKAKNNSTAVTSGNYERTRLFVNDIEEADNASQSELLDLIQYAPHIIDSKRGVPYTLEIVENEDGGWDYRNIESHVISATILSDSSMYADCLATSACIMGLEGAVVFLTNLDAEYGVKSLLFASDYRRASVGGFELTDTKKYNGYQSYAPLAQIGN